MLVCYIDYLHDDLFHRKKLIQESAFLVSEGKDTLNDKNHEEICSEYACRSHRRCAFGTSLTVSTVTTSA